MKIFNRIKSALKRAIGAFTPQTVAFALQMLTLVGWAVCAFKAQMCDALDSARVHWVDAMWTHVLISWGFTCAVVILGATDWGRTKFKKYYAKD